MAQFLELDPVARDYVFQGGSPVETDDILVRSYYALTIPLNNWLYGTTSQGSLIYTLENVKRTGAIEQEFAGYARDAIQTQLINQGYANAVGIKNLAVSRTGTSNQVQVVPTSKPVQSQFNFVSV